jgi:Tfp pilus tip-associated adhesin PilY1
MSCKEANDMKTKTRRLSTLLALTLSTALSFSTFQAASEDIDIFSVDVDSTVNKPNVLIVLDNSANWSRQSQQWPGGFQQGQSEVRAITRVLNQLPDNAVNVGLMEFITGGNAADQDSGFIRYHIRPMNSTNKGTISNILYGPSANGAPVASSIFSNINEPDEKRPQSNPFGNLFWDVYNYFAGINHSNGGAGTLDSKSDDAGYSTKHSVFRSPLASTDTCTRTIVIFIGNNVQNGPTPDSGTNGNTLTSLGGDASQIPFADYVVTSTPSTAVKGTSACHSTATSCSNTESTQDLDGNGISDCRDAGFTSCSCDVSTAQDCQQAKFSAFGRSTTQTVVSGPTTAPAETGVATGEATKCQNNDPGSYTCPLTSTAFTPGPGANQTTETTTSWSSCSYVEDDFACGNNDNKSLWTPSGTRTTTTTVRETTTVNTALAPSACSDDESSCDTSMIAGCPPGGTTYQSCFCSGGAVTSGCPINGQRYSVLGNFTSTTATQTGSFSPAPAGPFMMDEWARFMRNTGVPIPNAPAGSKTLVTTYTIDVFNAQQNNEFSALLFNTARVGGGKYFQAKNEDAIVSALTQIFNEIQAVNSAFASASLPVNATNRTQNENQVYIGLFRPDRQKLPLWFGNLKRYQIVANGAALNLGDSTGAIATNLQTGFIGDCAISYWTTDTPGYWDTVGTDNPAAISQCPSVADPHSDLPDGPFVEKGAAAEVLRKRSTARNMQTLNSAGTALMDFNTTNLPALNANTVNFILGKDVNDEDSDTLQTDTRSTIHGDVIHSRPQPINYGGTASEIAAGTKPGVVVFYGANDGTYRAVKAHNGEELWSFIAPEHHAKFDRLRANTTTIRFSGDTTGAPKDYFFDGSTSVYQNADNTDVRVYTTMRRGGRRVYAFNVTNPASPSFLWSRGCPNLTNDTSCDTGFAEIGQTWGFPTAAFIKGHSETQPVIVLAGGHDNCEDADNVITTGCAGAKGSGVFVINGQDGALLKHFDFNGRSVMADVALIDVNGDRSVDYGYAVDTGGKVYRMDFVDASRNPLAPAAWTFRVVAQADASSGRKFQFPPALVQLSGDVIYLAMGSGDREHPLITQYPYTSPVVNRFYVFKDDLSLPSTTTAIALDDATGTIMRNLTTEPAACATDASQCPAPLLPTSPEKGWYINLTANGQGEQVVSGALVVSGFVVFSTNRPTVTSTQACTNSLGEARGYFINLLNASGAIGVAGVEGGRRSSVFVGGGLPPTPVFAVVPVNDPNCTGPNCGTDLRPVLIGAVPKDGSAACTTCISEPPQFLRSKRTPLYWFRSGDTN